MAIFEFLLLQYLEFLSPMLEKHTAFMLENWHCPHKQISIDDFADLLCHDCLNNKFSDVTYKESTLVIPGMPEVTTMQMSENTTILKKLGAK